MSGSNQSGDGERPDRVGEATVRRYIDRGHDVIVARADLSPLIAAYLDHLRRWEQKVDELSQTLMSQGLAAAILHLSCRPRGETVGWTINIRHPATNIFIVGDSDKSTVTGRVFTEGVKTSDSSRIYVQISRPGKPLTQSTVEVTGLDLLLMFEQFYRRSEQIPARFFEISDSEYLMLLGLPEVEVDWLRDLTREEAVSLDSGDLESLGEGTYRYQCGCNPELIMSVVLNPYEDSPEELFRGDSGVEILCPRCGRRWWIGRDEFDRAAAAHRGEASGAGPAEPDDEEETI